MATAQDPRSDTTDSTNEQPRAEERNALTLEEVIARLERRNKEHFMTDAQEEVAE